MLIHRSIVPSSSLLLKPISLPPNPKPLKPKTLSISSSFSFSSTKPPLSVSDSDLLSRGFVLHSSASSLNLDDLNTVFVRVGFPRRDPAKIRKALDHTPSLFWIEHAKTRKPVAFARATGDGVFNAIIWDVVVDPSYQGFGLGKAVMERLIRELLDRGISNIALYAEPKVLGFYRPLGFSADPDGIRGMVYSMRQQQRKRN
ncbi:hypothetical protein AAC387_Pa03g2975 [Persea americana]